MGRGKRGGGKPSNAGRSCPSCGGHVSSYLGVWICTKCGYSAYARMAEEFLGID